METAPLFLRFAAFTPGVDACLVGSSSLAHLAELVRWIDAGPLPADLRAELDAAYAAVGADWRGVI